MQFRNNNSSTIKYDWKMWTSQRERNIQWEKDDQIVPYTPLVLLSLQ